MGILDLAFRFNSPLSGGNGSVPAGANLGQLASSDRQLNLLGKKPARRAWDTWDTPYTVPVGTAACGGSLGTPGTVGTPGTPGTVGTPGTAPRPYPNEWSEAIDRLLSRSCPDAVSTKDWTCACRGVEQVARGCAAKAMALGWTFEELFAAPFRALGGSLATRRSRPSRPTPLRSAPRAARRPGSIARWASRALRRSTSRRAHDHPRN